MDDISSPTGQYCGSPFNTVHIIRNTKNTMAVKYTTFVTNNTSSTQKFKFSSKKSGTTTLGASVTVGAEFKPLWFGAIEAEINASAERSWTSELGVEARGTVKARKTVYGKCGIKRRTCTATRHAC
ncbi:hypothetical protein [Streptomyces sp. NPDC058623]|uniref:hypothetical protein n=1 Tax=Streptomyces sp. NPDC058623 TaxID=3346563 RepID=UPI00365085B8